MAFMELGGSSAEREGAISPPCEEFSCGTQSGFKGSVSSREVVRMRRFASEENTVVIRRPEYSPDIGESRDCMAMGPSD